MDDLVVKHKISLEDRLEFYLNSRDEVMKYRIDPKVDPAINKGNGFAHEGQTSITKFRCYKGSFWDFYSKNLISKYPFSKIRSLPYFKKYRILLTLSDFLKFFDKDSSNLFDENFLLCHGELHFESSLPFIRKARRFDDKNSTLFKLGTIRHFQPCHEALKYDIDWKDKKDDVVWRGGPSNSKDRITLLDKYFHRYDVGFTSLKNQPHRHYNLKPRLSIAQQLQSKYIISLEGYDLASNLKWILISNSIPVMPKPKWMSWIIESNLKPYVHYLPLNEDLENLGELINWANNNQDQCRQIAKNGKMYMSQFFDEKREKEIQYQVLKKYSELYDFE